MTEEERPEGIAPTTIACVQVHSPPASATEEERPERIAPSTNACVQVHSPPASATEEERPERIAPSTIACVQVHSPPASATEEERPEGIVPSTNACVQVHRQPASATEEERPEGIALTIIKTSGDGRCFFRSIAVAMDTELQVAIRTEDGVPLDKKCQAKEQLQADLLRSSVVSYMNEHIDDYKDISDESGLLNADMPPTVKFSSITERMASMTNPKTMPGELEIVALQKVLERKITVVDEDGKEIIHYGENSPRNKSPLLLRFQKLSEDVGHYDCAIKSCCTPALENKARIDEKETRNEKSLAVLSPTEIRDMIYNISPIPKAKEKRKRTRKQESAAIVTSSPYKRMLTEKASTSDSSKLKRKVPPTEPKKQTKKTVSKRKGRRSRKKAKKESESSEEEWPCIYCCEPYANSRPGETWIECQQCKRWAHSACTDDSAYFICMNCESEDEQ